MSAVPTRRLLVYVAAGTVVLIVGFVSLACFRDDAEPTTLTLKQADNSLVIWTAPSDSAASASERSSVSSPTSSSASTTSATTPAFIYVQVAGAVRNPGVYRLSAQARVFEAIRAAGGFTEEADQDAVAQAAPLVDGCRVFVPRKGASGPDQLQGPELSWAGVVTVSPGGSLSGTTGSGGTRSEGRISLNNATAAELESLPGIGPALAERIVSYREANGLFQSVDELLNVPGIGPAKLEQIRPYVGL